MNCKLYWCSTRSSSTPSSAGVWLFLRHYHDIITQIKKLKFCHLIKTILETLIRFRS